MKKTNNIQRRDFLKQAGTGIPFLAISTNRDNSRLSSYDYGKINSLENAKNEVDEIAILITFTSENPKLIAAWEGRLKAKNGKIARMRSWFQETKEDNFDLKKGIWQAEASQRSSDILVIWLKDSSESTEIHISQNEKTLDFTLKDLLNQPEIKQIWGNAVLTINILPYKEIGEILPSEVGIQKVEKDFSFVLMADPQGGNPKSPALDSPTRMKIHNAFIEESIRRVNELDPQPAFTIVNGDFVDSKGQRENFEAMIEYYQALKSPLLIELGNHETAYSAKFTPGYNMEAFNNYFAAQKAVNGLEKLLYSFNLGEWHFVIWPDPLRDNFWETHPHYFDWLERDLEKYKDRPTIFIHHVPLHPIGINPLINYVEGVEVKRTLLDILAIHGNVKYVFSGHVHIPLKASIKTACDYRGMKFINLPPAGYRPRAFGEQEIEGGPSQGIVIVEIREKNVTIKFKNVINKVFTYPKHFPEFQPEKWPLWLTHPWELPAESTLQNGNFEKGLAHWHKRYVYMEDENPSNICKVCRQISENSYQSLYLFSRSRGYMKPGQDRLPQSINRICQAVSISKGSKPVLSFDYVIERAFDDPDQWAGAYIWIEGYQKSHKKLNLLYSAGKAYRDPGGKRSKSFQANYQHFQLPINAGKWQQAQVNLKLDAEQNGLTWDELAIDRLIIHLGVWVQNDLSTQAFGIYFDNLKLKNEDSLTKSLVDHQTIFPTPKKDIYSKRIDHICGEHVQIESS